MASLESFLMHRVDAARTLARLPGRAAEASGRLFVAKRCHEALKAGHTLDDALPEILAAVSSDLPAAAREGACREADVVARRITRA